MRRLLAALFGLLLLVGSGTADDLAASAPVGVGAHVRIRLLEIPAATAGEDAMRTHWCDAFGVTEPDRGKFVVRLDDDKARRIAAGADGGKAPIRLETRTWVLDGQPAILYDASEEAYVQDYELEVPREVRQVIGTLRDGVSLAVTPKEMAGSWQVRIHGSLSAAVRPIPLYKADFAGENVEIQLPELRLAQFDESFAVEGQSAWFLVGAPVVWSDNDGRSPTTRVALVRFDRARLRPLQLEAPGDEDAK